MAGSKDVKTIIETQAAKHLPNAEGISVKRHLSELDSMFKDYVKNIQDIHNDECTLSRELSTLKDQINQIEFQVDNLELTEFELQNKLQEVAKYQKEQYLKQLQIFFELLGYSIKIIKNDDENKGRLYVMEYSNNCSVVLKHTQDHHAFELMEIKPNHLNFPALKKLLEISQDVQGFLFNIGQYFDTIGTTGN